MSAWGGGPAGVTIRRAPWPYAAMLAVCSDLDETPDARVYLEIARFLNTKQPTSMGEGVGLEVGNTIYFDMPPGQFSYWGTDDQGRDMARALMRSGHIDGIHSWGDLATERRHAERNLAELGRHGCRLEVWIDHSKAPSNFGADIMKGKGDLPGAAVYHADLTLAHGVRYVWRGRTTGVTGQDAPLRVGSFTPLLRRDRALVSVRSAIKEIAKVLLGRLGSSRWGMYGANRSCRPCRLRDGQPAWEFLRSNPSWGGPGESATAAGLAEVLTTRMLDRLVACGGTTILYTHLGKVQDRARPFGPDTVRALRALARLRDEKRVLVTTTQRLLRYVTMRDVLRYRVAARSAMAVVTLDSIDDPVTGPRAPTAGDLDGLTLGVAGVDGVELCLGDGTRLPGESIRGSDGTTWVSLPWPPLRFPHIL
jgi:hypothetical protein